jgi:hypothetical protein
VNTYTFVRKAYNTYLGPHIAWEEFDSIVSFR